MNADVLLMIGEEIQQARKIHRPFPSNDPVRAAAILAEECGEVAQAALDMTRPGIGLASVVLQKELVREILQVAAVCVMWLDAFVAESEENKKKERESAKPKDAKS